MTYDHAIQAVQQCSYASASENDLREMLRACMDIHGANPTAHHRITHAAEIIRLELQSRFLSGERTWLALKRSVEELARSAPADHDILLMADNIRVLNANFIPPHSFLFQGVDENGYDTGVVVHFSQLKARVVYLPKRGPERVITGFADGRVA
jgi:hypothetical protein